MPTPGEDDYITVRVGDDDKHAWRQRILAWRSAVSPAEQDAEARALSDAARAAVTPGSTVCAYVPTRTEPGSLDLLVELAAAAARVLLPITGDPGPLTWAEFTGVDDLTPARFGLLEPTGPRLEPDTIADADTVLIPALAVDRRGVRLGRGAGYYDRTLPLARPTARLIAVVRDTEVVPELPEERHDARMGWSLTPGAGLRRLGREFPAE